MISPRNRRRSRQLCKPLLHKYPCVGLVPGGTRQIFALQGLRLPSLPRRDRSIEWTIPAATFSPSGGLVESEHTSRAVLGSFFRGLHLIRPNLLGALKARTR